MIESTAIGSVVETLIETGSWKATKYISPIRVITATRKLFMGRINKRENIDIVLKIGRPNYDERAFIKVAKKAGEPFPIKRILLKAIPVRK